MRSIKCSTGEVANSYKNYLNTNHWKIMRIKVRDKYKNKCAECGYKNNLQVHHISYVNIGFEKMNELILLCDICHLSEHRNMKLKVEENINYDNKLKIKNKELIEKEKEAKDREDHKKHERIINYLIKRFGFKKLNSREVFLIKRKIRVNKDTYIQAAKRNKRIDIIKNNVVIDKIYY